jgi:hypothetical protein
MKASAAASTSIRSGTFWAELKPAEHLLQCWTHEEELMETLEAFVSSGLRAGEGVVVIATAAHLHEIEKRLRAHWLEIDRARWEERYIPLLAPEVLAQVIGDDGMPDEASFDRVAQKLLERAGQAGARKMRFFAELASVLWAQGNIAATIQLENLWTRFLRERQAPLFCAYSRDLFAGHPSSAMKGVCALHTLILPG